MSVIDSCCQPAATRNALRTTTVCLLRLTCPQRCSGSALPPESNVSPVATASLRNSDALSACQWHHMLQHQGHDVPCTASFYPCQPLTNQLLTFDFIKCTPQRLQHPAWRWPPRAVIGNWTGLGSLYATKELGGRCKAHTHHQVQRYHCEVVCN